MWARGARGWRLMGTVRCSTRGRRQWRGAADARALNDRVDRIGCDVLECFNFSAGPADLHGFHFLGGTQAEVQAQIVLREITSSAAYLAELLNSRGTNRHARADRSAIALCADEFE